MTTALNDDQPVRFVTWDNGPTRSFVHGTRALDPQTKTIEPGKYFHTLCGWVPPVGAQFTGKPMDCPECLDELVEIDLPLGNDHNQKTLWEKLRRDVVGSALDAFWGQIAIGYPEVRSGDFPPDAEFRMSRAACEAVETWLQMNGFDLNDDPKSNGRDDGPEFIAYVGHDDREHGEY